MRHPCTQAIFAQTILCLVGLMLAFGRTPQVASARQATPSATPVAVVCDVMPRSVEEMVALLKPLDAEQPVLELKPLPPGETADPATEAAITAVVRQLEACINAGDELRVMSLSSDILFQQMPKSDEIVAELTALASRTPSPAPEGKRQVLIGPWHVQELADGRVLAAVLFTIENEPLPDPIHTKAIYFVQQNEQWLIQEMNEVLPAEDCDSVAAMVGPPPGVSVGSWPTSCF